MHFIRNIVILGLISAGTLAGCATQEDDDGDVSEGALTPAQQNDTFEQVKTCDNLFKDRLTFRAPDLKEGVLRWKCGDVDGVTVSACEDNLDKIAARETSTNIDVERANKLGECGDGFGQEYCEYNAVSKGRVVNSVASAKAVKDSDPVECVFTSVHTDFEGQSSHEGHKRLAAKLKSQLTDASRDLEGRVAGMKQSVNSRDAADTLIQDCSKLGASGDADLHKNAERQVVCYNAWRKASGAAKSKLQTKCANVDLSGDSAWKATGLAEATLTDTDRDLAACTMILKAEHGGVSWRNSDPTICARAYRATRECKVTFKEIGDVVPDFQGFSMMGWANRETLPADCRYANDMTDEGGKYRQVVICKPNQTDVKTYRTQKKPLQQLCRDRFAQNVAMQAPIGALANLSGANTDGEFCSAFVGGAKAAQGE